MFWKKKKPEAPKSIDPLTLGYCDRCLKTFKEDENSMEAMLELHKDGVKINVANASFCRECAQALFFGAVTTQESERAALEAEVGKCCEGTDPMCAGGCLVEKAVRYRAASGAAAWLYAIEDSKGNWKDGEHCVFGDQASAQDEVDLLNDEPEHEQEYRVVPLYRAASGAAGQVQMRCDYIFEHTNNRCIRYKHNDDEHWWTGASKPS